MKTAILTSELLKLIDPTKDEITYKDQKVKLNFKELKRYINDPKKYDVFNVTGEFEKDLYKNLALYIINAGFPPSLINLDLDKPTIFESGKGLFEYIKNVYLNEEKSYITLPETGDNLLLIQSNSLSPLSNDSVIELQDADDMHYATAASALVSNPESVKRTRGQVTWQQLNSNMYGDLTYVLQKVDEAFGTRRKSNHGNDVSNEKLFENLLLKIGPELSQSDEFKLSLMDLNSRILNDLFIDRYNENNPETYFIDYSQPIFQAKLLEQVKDGQFLLLSQLFDSFLEYREKYHNDDAPRIAKRLKDTIDFTTLLNQSETIEYLLKQSYDNDGVFKHAGNEFTLASAYPFLDNEKRLDHSIAKKCVDLAYKKSMNGYVNIREEIIFKLEPVLFNEPFVLTPLIGNVDADKIKRFLSYRGEFPILKDKEFILPVTKKLYGYKLAEWIHTFFDKDEIDKEFIKDLVRNNPNFLEKINEEKDSKLDHFAFDPEITLAALEGAGGAALDNIGTKTMLPLLLIEHDEKIEKLKLMFLIKNRLIGDFDFKLRNKGDDLDKLKKKYYQPEFLFYDKESSFLSGVENRRKSVSKFTTEDEVFEVLDKVKKMNLDCVFLSKVFYEGLTNDLRRSKSIVNRLLDFGNIPYRNLDPTVAYNSDIALRCLSKDKEDVKDIPAELFTNAKFALGFAKLMDKHHFKEADIPPFVTKFFENQEVTNKYEEHLKEHIFYTDLQTDLDKPGEVKKTKRAKL